MNISVYRQNTNFIISDKPKMMWSSSRDELQPNSNICLKYWTTLQLNANHSGPKRQPNPIIKLGCWNHLFLIIDYRLQNIDFSQLSLQLHIILADYRTDCCEHVAGKPLKTEPNHQMLK